MIRRITLKTVPARPDGDHNDANFRSETEASFCSTTSAFTQITRETKGQFPGI